MAAPARVLIDALALSDDSAYRGIGTYVRTLLRGLSADPRLRMAALSGSEVELPVGVERRLVRDYLPGRFRAAERDLRLSHQVARAGADVFLSPGLDPPRRASGPWVSTIHDVIPLVLDYSDLAVERRRWDRYRDRYREATAVVAISNYTAREATRVLALDPGRIEVIPHGVDSRFRPPASREQADPPYVLSVGEYSQRKGYDEAFAMIGELAERGLPHRLHVVGRVAPWLRPAVDAALARAPRPDRVEIRGFVEDLVGEYQRASLVVVTSRYEGFGLPILEAMACGTPVVAFSNSAIAEIVGDAGVLVDDGDSAQMAKAVHEILGDHSRQDELRHRGIEHASEYTWERSVRAHADLLLRIADV